MPDVAAPAITRMAHPVMPEDRARADFYALLARLFAGAPDAALLRAIADAPALGVPTLTEGLDQKSASLGVAWDRLRAASGVMEVEAAEQEYFDLFVGVGKSEANLHASHWLTGFMMEKPLADVRATLATLGLGRKSGVSMVEDHLAALCETMRLLIAGHEDRPPAGVQAQKSFFERHIIEWVDRCCTAIEVSPIANYYRGVAQFTQCFMALERDSFAIE